MKPKAVPVPLSLRLQSIAVRGADACSLAASGRANGARSGVGDVRGSLVGRVRREVSS